MVKNNQIGKGETKSAVAMQMDMTIRWTCNKVNSELDYWQAQGYPLTRELINTVLNAIIKA